MMAGKGGGAWGAGESDWGAGVSDAGAAASWGQPKAKKGSVSASSDWGVSKATAGKTPEIKSISLEGSQSSLLLEGYGADAPALEFWKECAIFSDANDILSSFFDDDWHDHVTLEHDPD